MAEAARTQSCPDCAVTLPVNHGYLTWCEACGWNLTALPERLSTGPLARIYASAGRVRVPRSFCSVFFRANNLQSLSFDEDLAHF